MLKNIEVRTYRGIDYMIRRPCDVLDGNESRGWRIFEMGEHEITGNHFATIADFENHVDDLKRKPNPGKERKNV